MPDPFLLNLFLAVGSIAMLMLFVFFAALTYYLVRLQRGVRAFADAAGREAQAFREDLEAARRFVHTAGSLVAELLPPSKKKRKSS